MTDLYFSPVLPFTREFFRRLSRLIVWQVSIIGTLMLLGMLIFLMIVDGILSFVDGK